MDSVTVTAPSEEVVCVVAGCWPGNKDSHEQSPVIAASSSRLVSSLSMMDYGENALLCKHKTLWNPLRVPVLGHDVTASGSLKVDGGWQAVLAEERWLTLQRRDAPDIGRVRKPLGCGATP